MTPATEQALSGLRDLSMIKWYIIPLLAIVFYIYTREIKEARQTKNWNAVLAGLTIFGVDFFNETWNGWVMYLTQRSAFWTTPGDTALRTMVGWNIEIMFMFLILGIIYYHTLIRKQKRENSRYAGKMVLGDRLQRFLCVCRMPAQHRRTSCLGISFLVFIL